jgi:hypothetical protein
MPNPIARRLTELPKLGKSALCQLWEQVFDGPAPTRLRRDLMILILSYRIQEQTFGGLRPPTRSRLRQIARALDANPDAALSAVPSLKPGTRLVRGWGNKVHIVEVDERGYRYEGGRYTSLSEIACLITGTRWSGPVFFGLKQKPKLEKVQ